MSERKGMRGLAIREGRRDALPEGSEQERVVRAGASAYKGQELDAQPRHNDLHQRLL